MAKSAKNTCCIVRGRNRTPVLSNRCKRLRPLYFSAEKKGREQWQIPRGALNYGSRTPRCTIEVSEQVRRFTESTPFGP
nr:MAG TPA: hypothetical protein [Caudoviricetes sp.]